MRLAHSMVTIVLGATLAGCIGDQTADDPLQTSLDEVVGDVVAHTSAGAIATPDAWRGLDIRLAATGFGSGEPTLGVTRDGTLFATPAFFGGIAENPQRYEMARSRDNGATWEAVGDPILGPKADLDPWMWVDSLTDRVYHAPLYVVCTWAEWSDDGGDSWMANPITGCGIPAHDHQKLTTGPPAEGVQTMGYPNVVYYQYNSFRQEGTWVTTSLDGGMTYGIGTVAHPSDCHSGIAGPVAVAPDGTAYLPKPACDGLNIAVSRDSGATWEVTGRVNGAGISPALATTVDAAVDPDGNAYAVYTGEDGRIYMTRSTDAGASWSDPFVVSPPEVTVTVFSVIATGDPGRVAIGYLGTTADASDWDEKHAEDASDDTRWHLYMTFSEDALAGDPVFVSQRVTPEDDPVQIGCVWLSGGGEPCRNMLDFIDIVEHDGRAYLAFADGCIECSSADDSRDSDLTIAIVEAGPSLRVGTLAPLAAAPVDEGARSNNVVADILK